MSETVWNGYSELTYADLAENEKHLRYVIDTHMPDRNSGQKFCPTCCLRAPCDMTSLAATALAQAAENARLEADLRAAREEAAALRASNERLRAALIHRCVVKTIDTRCEGCQEIAALLAPAEPAPQEGQ